MYENIRTMESEWKKKLVLNVQMKWMAEFYQQISIEYVLYQMSIRLELTALLPKWNQYFSLADDGG